MNRHSWQLRQMIETRRGAIEGQVEQRIYACRDRASEGTTGPPADLSNEPADEHLASARCLSGPGAYRAMGALRISSYRSRLNPKRETIHIL
jgi:hypothetical protein